MQILSILSSVIAAAATVLPTSSASSPLTSRDNNAKKLYLVKALENVLYRCQIHIGPRDLTPDGIVKIFQDYPGNECLREVHPWVQQLDKLLRNQRE